ncbi:hypothetical protein QBC38DRAFT_359732 [Podospora fimiseda]|uniref:DUF159 domain protein n=1 Tax=Podospora fimiseda TaxID=252190 RepID=A0AAN7BTJ9_9PEZI|nr:hypothetical protein QBC38DRAFT_359732 [Podospora fimiseda]
MCGRYALALRPSQIRQQFQDYNIPVDDAPEDEGDDAPRQSYNFAPGYHGMVYRVDVGDRGSAHREVATTATTSDRKELEERSQDQEADVSSDGLTNSAIQEPSSFGEDKETSSNSRPQYKLQSMKWGLIPFWTKRNPDYAAVLKTINCRDDSLAQPGGMWNTMKKGKRCIVVVEGFYEWLKKGPKEKVPHYVKRKDGKLMLLAGLWDCVTYEDNGQRLYTYTIITTSSNEQLRFLHDRMPVVLEPGSEEMKAWLDPKRHEWSAELQTILKPYRGELEVYPVSKDVGKVGNNSPTFVIPVASKENKLNIANFFQQKGAAGKVKPEATVKKEGGDEEKKTVEELQKTTDDGGMDTSGKGIKREAESPSPSEAPPTKKAVTGSVSPVKARLKISATKNPVRSPAKGKGKGDGSQKITKFFGNSA